MPKSISSKTEVRTFKAIYSNLSTGVALLQRDKNFMFANDAFHRMLGFEIGKLRDQNLEEVIYQNDLPATMEQLNELAAGNKVQMEVEVRFLTCNGKTLWGKLWASLVKDAADKPEYILVMVQDITKYKRMEEDNRKLLASLDNSVEERTAQLKAANKELEAFSYSVSHDLRAPLRAVAGYTSILKEDYTERFDEEGKEILGYVINNTHKMGRLIDELLSFSRMQRKTLVSEKFSLGEMVEDKIRDMKIINEQLSIQFNYENLPDAYGDPTLMSQVLQNLLDNAIKFSSKNDVVKINIEAEDNGKEVKVQIKDNGVGFDMKYYDKIFGVFQRLHGENEFSGTGVGLALVQRIILKHEGRIWAESIVGKGATFYFTLPHENYRL